MSWRLPIPALCAAAVAVGCAGPVASSAPARIHVELLRGFAPDAGERALADAPVVIILDLTRSMGEPTEFGPPHHVAARRAAARLVRSLPASRPTWLYAVGSGEIAECQPVYRVAQASAVEEREELLARAQSLPARGEGALAHALDAIRGELTSAGAVAGSRVAVFSDLGAECGGDVCAAAERLVAAGVRLDVVAIGEATAPACLAQIAGPRRPVVPLVAAGEVPFHLETGPPNQLVVGCSATNQLPVAFTGGPGVVEIALDPPLRVAKDFEPGVRHVLQVLDFPGLEPPQRRWRWRNEAPLPPIEAGPVEGGE